MKKSFFTKSETETLNIAKIISNNLNQGDIIALIGDLGTGKTVFSRGIIHSLGCDKMVNSPTFVIMKPYNTNIFTVYHFDVYRLNSIHELEEIGYKDYIYSSGISIIEWADKIIDELPSNKTIKIFLEHISENERKIEIQHYGGD